MQLYLVIVFVVAAILFTACSYFVRDKKLLLIGGAILVLTASLIILSGGIEYSTGVQIKQPVESTTAFFLNQTFFQDNGFKALQTVDKSSYYLKKGDEFIISDYDDSVNSDDFNMFCTGNKSVYGVLKVAASKSGSLSLYENPVIDVNGTECGDCSNCVHVSKNRLETKDNNVSFFEDPTFTDKGDLISKSYIPASTANKGVGDVSNEDNWVFEPDSCYVLEFVPESAGTPMSLRLVYNEVDEK